MSRFNILLAGALTPTDRLRRQVAGGRTIAADAGMVHARALGLEVELWVGDFDSASAELLTAHDHIPRQRHPAAKDATDGELAIDEALKRGASSIVLVGGMGGQTDHVMGHLGLIVRLALDGTEGMISTGTEEAWPLIPGEHDIDLPPSTRLSIFGFDDLTALSLDGVDWPLDKRDVPLGSTLTLSNVARGPVRISLERGHGAIFAYPPGAAGSSAMRPPSA